MYSYRQNLKDERLEYRKLIKIEYISELVIKLNIHHLATSVSSVKLCSVFVTR